MRRFFLFPLLLLLFLTPLEAAEVSVDNLQLQLEFTRQARCLAEASALIRSDQNLPHLRLELQALFSNSSLKSTLEGEIEELPGKLENLLFFLSPQLLNIFLSRYEGKTLREIREGSGDLPAVEFLVPGFPREGENWVLKKMEIRKLERLYPGVKFSLSVVLEGTGGREYFPLHLWLSMERMEGGGLLSARAGGGLPRRGNRVVVNSLPLGRFLEGISLGKFSLILKVPEGAEVSGLPEGFENLGGTYVFSGENMELFQTLAGELEGMSLSYEYFPPPSSFPFPLLLVPFLVIPLSFFLKSFYGRGKRKKDDGKKADLQMQHLWQHRDGAPCG